MVLSKMHALVEYETSQQAEKAVSINCLGASYFLRNSDITLALAIS